ncbi:MAG: D-alanyl-D-alanine carboxypeptidase family protein, partial [Opitutaceae bacterium]|nr:D-alanyl-D-alanine carboxypeptidase family protein [Opitutaceae bacterium]
MNVVLSPRISALHRELGIPPGYADERRLALQPEISADELVDIGQNPDGSSVLLAKPAAAAWFDLHRAAAKDGIELLPISGFRSVDRQVEIVGEKVAGRQPLAEILRTVAAPGFSEHHTGRALDIGSPEDVELDEDFARTTAFGWLERHAAQFGFRLSYPRDNPHGIGYEPWHWCWHR